MFQRLIRILLLTVMIWPQTSVAQSSQTVRLVANESGLILIGEIVLFDGVNYRFRAAVGEVLVSANQVVCMGDACPANAVATGGTFGIFGSNTVGETLMPSLIEAYANSKDVLVERELTSDPAHSRLVLIGPDDSEIGTVDLHAEGSSTSFPALLSGDALIGMSSRKVKGSESDAFAAAGSGPIDIAGREHVVALDGLIILVSQDNPVSALSLSDIAAMFAGKITNWAEVGGANAPINIYARDDVSGTWDTFKSLVLSPQDVELSPQAQRFQSSASLSDTVAADPNGIGFAGFAYERNARSLTLRTSCGLEIPPTSFGVKTEEYPLARRLYLYTSGAQLPPVAADILGFSLSESAQGIVAQAGFVDQAVDVGRPDGEDNRLFAAGLTAEGAVAAMMARSMSSELRDAVRLSPTLRFTADERDLDVKSRGDVTRIAQFIKDELDPSTELLLVGYADDSTGIEAGLESGMVRALRAKASIESDLALIGGPRDRAITALAYGPLAPVACNDSDKGRATNRRVEVWLRDKR